MPYITLTYACKQCHNDQFAVDRDLEELAEMGLVATTIRNRPPHLPWHRHLLRKEHQKQPRRLHPDSETVAVIYIYHCYEEIVIRKISVLFRIGVTYA